MLTSMLTFHDLLQARSITPMRQTIGLRSGTQDLFAQPGDVSYTLNSDRAEGISKR
jgi:hypothetical protein